MHVANNARLENRKSSNGWKIARMARILTIFGPKRSQRPKLFHEKFSNERNERKVPEKFEKISNKKSKNSQYRYCRRHQLLRNAIKFLRMTTTTTITTIQNPTETIPNRSWIDPARHRIDSQTTPNRSQSYLKTILNRPRNNPQTNPNRTCSLKSSPTRG